MTDREQRAGAMRSQTLVSPVSRSMFEAGREHVASGEASVMELAEPFRISQPAVSKHLKVLERAGLIARARDAQRRPSRLQARPLDDVSRWVEGLRRTWEARLDQLDDYLQELQEKGEER